MGVQKQKYPYCAPNKIAKKMKKKTHQYIAPLTYGFTEKNKNELTLDCAYDPCWLAVCLQGEGAAVRLALKKETLEQQREVIEILYKFFICYEVLECMLNCRLGHLKELKVYALRWFGVFRVASLVHVLTRIY